MKSTWAILVPAKCRCRSKPVACAIPITRSWRTGRPWSWGTKVRAWCSRSAWGVSNVAPGDRVLLNWAMPCGNCFACRGGLRNLCEKKPVVPNERLMHKGRGLPASFGLGTMSTAAVVPHQAVIKLDVEMPFTSACILGCCVMTGYGSVVNVAKVQAGSSCVVIGAGAVGICCIQAARIAGATAIVAVDVNPAKLKYAESFGATHSILADRADAGLVDAARRVRELFEGRGADYAFESTSVPALGRSAAGDGAQRRNRTCKSAALRRNLSIDMRVVHVGQNLHQSALWTVRSGAGFPQAAAALSTEATQAG